MNLKLRSGILGLSVVAACGGDGPKCGVGTVKMNGECLPEMVDPPDDTVPPVVTASPSGGTYRDMPAFVTLSADEPATIFYTTDGSDPTDASTSAAAPVLLMDLLDGTEVRFFGRDPSNNQSAVGTAAFTIDQPGPSPATTFAATNASGDASLSWSVPSEATGVIVARVPGSRFERPVGGTQYAVGDSIPGGGMVVFAGNGTAATDTAMPPGGAHYAAWTHDELYNYSGATSTALHPVLPAQTFTVRHDFSPNATTLEVAAPTVTVTLAPRNTGPQKDIDVTFSNATGRILYGAKLVVRGVTNGTFTSSPDGTLGADPYLELTHALLPGETVQERVQLTPDVPGVSIVDANFEVVINRVFLAPGWLRTVTSPTFSVYDSVTADIVGNVAPDALSFGWRSDRDNSAIRPGVQSPNGRFIWVGSRVSTRLTVYDVALETAVAGVDIATNSIMGNVDWPIARPGHEEIYAVVNDGGHAARFDSSSATNRPDDPNSVYVIRLDPVTLTETGRIELALVDPTADTVRGRRPDVSPDGRWLAVPVLVGVSPFTSAVHLIDLDAFSEVDTDSATAGIQPVNVTGALIPTAVKFNPTGDRLYTNSGFDNGDKFAFIAMVDYSVNVVGVQAPLTAANVKAIGFAANGDVYLCGRPTEPVGLYTWTPGDGTFAKVTDYAETDCTGLHVDESGDLWAYRTSLAAHIEMPAGTIKQTFAMSNTYGHRLLMTPY